MKIGVIKQKGGVGASTLARMIAVNYSAAQWNVKIADMDTKQGTSTRWNGRRLSNEIEPNMNVQQFASVSSAVNQSNDFDLLVFDGAPHSSKQTLEIAKVSDLVLIPTGTSIDDLEPAILLCHELKAKGINMDNVYLVFCRVGNSLSELDESLQYVKQSRYNYFNTVMYEKTAVRRASDEGKAAIETKFKSINQTNDALLQNIVDKLTDLTK
jgi:chromosome partitioning protein